MSGIFDQIINYSPPLIVSGTVNYKGTWNASTNNPTLNNPPAASTKGDYYVVSTAGTQFSITFGVGDWIISNGTAWEKVDLTDAVSSVFGRTGAVVGVSTDYSAVGLTNTAIGASSPSTGAFTSLSSSSTTTLNGTTIPASKTLVVTTDKLSALAATTSAELAGVISDETGSGALVFANSPTLVTPILGTPQSGTVTNLTGTASININGTVGATTPSTGAFSTLSASSGITSTTINTTADITVSGASALAYRLTRGAVQGIWQNGATVSYFGTASAHNTEILVNNAVVGAFSSTGLAVTGALSSTGAATITGAVNSANAFVSTGAVTANAANRVTLDFGSGVEGRVLAWGPNNATAGQLVLGVLSANASVGSTSIATITSTGLAVTGALSSTGALAIGNTVATAVAVASTHKVTIVIGGTTYYLLATNV